MRIVRLPVSRMEVTLRQPTGVEDIVLLEAPRYDTDLAVALLSHIASSTDGPAIAWDALCVTDLEALLLSLRQMLVGDVIRTDILCPAPGCGKRIDVIFRIGDYLSHHSPRTSRSVEPADDAGWYRLHNTPVSFRLPTAADQIKATRGEKPERTLMQLCIRPTTISARLLKRVETAMETLAPQLSHDVQGQCPECGQVVDMFFDVQQFVLSELSDRATFIYEDIHLLAMYYHWSEAAILALPRSRRTRYTEMVQQAERSLV